MQLFICILYCIISVNLYSVSNSAALRIRCSPSAKDHEKLRQSLKSDKMQGAPQPEVMSKSWEEELDPLERGQWKQMQKVCRLLNKRYAREVKPGTNCHPEMMATKRSSVQSFSTTQHRRIGATRTDDETQSTRTPKMTYKRNSLKTAMQSQPIQSHLCN